MKPIFKTFAMALLVAVFTVISFISLRANDGIKETKNFPGIYSQPDDTDKKGDSGSGGPVIPPNPGD